MIGVTLDRVKFMFDKKPLQTAAERFTQRLLGRFGAYTRTIQRNSLKRARGHEVSQPGNPPLRHTGAQVDIKDTVFFVVDPERKEVVIGMVLLRIHSSGRPAMPGILESGGSTWITSHGKTATVTIEARPSAHPAFKKAIEKLLPSLIEEGLVDDKGVPKFGSGA